MGLGLGESGGKGGGIFWEGKVGEIVPCQDLEDFSKVVPIFFEYLLH